VIEGRPWRPDGLPQGPVVKICGLTRLEDVLLARALGAWALGFVFAPSPRRLTPSEARKLINDAAAALQRGRAPSLPAGHRTGETSRARGEAASRGTGGSGSPLAVGVFGDVSAAEVARVVEQVGLDAVQLHGRAGPAPAEVRDALAGWAGPLALADARAAASARAAENASFFPFPPPLVVQVVPVPPDQVDLGVLRRAIAGAAAEADLVLLDTRTTGRLGGSGTTFPWRLAREVVEGKSFLVAGGIDPRNVQAALKESGAWGADVSSGIESSAGAKDPRLLGQLLARVEAMRQATPGAAGMDERQEGLER
jgi:phosphoribosylanthranilate isomerase